MTLPRRKRRPEARRAASAESAARCLGPRIVVRSRSVASSSPPSSRGRRTSSAASSSPSPFASGGGGGGARSETATPSVVGRGEGAGGDDDEERPPLFLLPPSAAETRSSPSDAASAREGLALPLGTLGPGQASARTTEQPGEGAGEEDEEEEEDGDRGHRVCRQRPWPFALAVAVVAVAAAACVESRISATVAPDRSLASCMSRGHIQSLERAPSSTLGEGSAVRTRERSGGPGALELDIFRFSLFSPERASEEKK